MIIFTEKAIAKVKEFAVAENLTDKPLRITIVGNGCSGFSYSLSFEEEEIKDNDLKFIQDGITIIVDPMSSWYIDGTEVDYVENDYGEGFKFNNSNETGKCGGCPGACSW